MWYLLFLGSFFLLEKVTWNGVNATDFRNTYTFWATQVNGVIFQSKLKYLIRNRDGSYMYLTVSLLKSSFWKRIVLTRAGFYPSTFLQPVNGRKNSILHWVLKLNFFKSLQVFFLYVGLEKSETDFCILLHHCFYFCKPQIRTKQNRLNYSIRNSTKKFLQLRSKNQKQTWWCRSCFFCFCVYYL